MEFNEDYKTVSLVYGDTDSLYSEWGSLLHTIDGYEDMTHEQRLEIVLRINKEFLDPHNKEYIADYYKGRNACSVHEFELETCGFSGFWLTKKKKYAQLLAFKEGMYYDSDSFPLKIKGLEIVKSSTPKLARAQLSNLVRYFLTLENDKNLIFKLNIRMQELWTEWKNSELEDICESININNYTKYIANDTDEMILNKGAQGHYKGACYHNYLINKYKCQGEPIYSGKAKYYQVDKRQIKGRQDFQEYFIFGAGAWKPWMQEYAPIDRQKMFQKNVMDPFNRILESMDMQTLTIDGHIQPTLFG